MKNMSIFINHYHAKTSHPHQGYKLHHSRADMYNLVITLFTRHSPFNLREDFRVVTFGLGSGQDKEFILVTQCQQKFRDFREFRSVFKSSQLSGWFLCCSDLLAFFSTFLFFYTSLFKVVLFIREVSFRTVFYALSFLSFLAESSFPSLLFLNLFEVFFDVRLSSLS